MIYGNYNKKGYYIAALFGEYQVLDKDKLFYVCPVVKFLTHRSFLS